MRRYPNRSAYHTNNALSAYSANGTESAHPVGAGGVSVRGAV